VKTEGEDVADDRWLVEFDSGTIDLTLFEGNSRAAHNYTPEQAREVAAALLYMAEKVEK